ncbi:hypothetical protein L1765_03725 [Microaerobacter geothermalis]|uniref:hypothetical protein n=1 Tax=Microaerobacter geothermalis TaxID=674972 RepID=UPI001F268BC2|nr:hypothetical protein [Microaerobacter geothermalis]MCF6093103.1 hypothetical protein [Microaerobacter geothermalis]
MTEPGDVFDRESLEKIKGYEDLSLFLLLLALLLFPLDVALRRFSLSTHWIRGNKNIKANPLPSKLTEERMSRLLHANNRRKNNSKN